jgi:transcriptional regulator with XRE-family HTH domain
MAPRHEPQVALGRAIRQARLERGLSQEELAHRSGLHPTWISHLESGRRNPSWGNIGKLCAALDMPVSELAQLAEQLDEENPSGSD